MRPKRALKHRLSPYCAALGLLLALLWPLTKPDLALASGTIRDVAQDPTGEDPIETTDDTADDEEDRSEGLKYRVEEEGEFTPSLLKALKAALPLYVGQKDRPRSRAQLRDRLAESLKLGRTVLQSQGYYAGRIRGRIAAQTDRDARRSVVLKIKSGARYTYKDAVIRLTGQDNEDVTNALKQTAGEITAIGSPANATSGVQLAPALTIRLKELGYPFASVKSQKFIVDHAAQSVQPLIDIVPGFKARITDLNILGLETVEAGYVRLLSDLTDNPIYDQRDVDAFRDRLIGTGLFSGIRILPADTAATSQQDIQDITLNVELSEADLRQVSAQAGFSTDQGFSVEGAWTHRNFFGNGEIFTVRGRLAQLEQSIETSLTLPNFKRIDQSLTLGFGIGREDTDAFNLLRATSTAILERRLTQRWIVSGGGQLEAQRVEDDLGKRTFYLGALPLSARYDGADDVFDPQDGIRLNFLVTPEAGFGDASLFFITTDTLVRAYKSFEWLHGTVLAARIRVGAIFGEETVTLPANRRFYAGGGGSIRGYGFQNVGPLNDDGDPFGGRSLVEMSAEARLKVTPTIGVVPFLDVGNVYQSTLPKLSGLQYGAGIGLRYHTDFAPIRLDIGTPLNPRDGDDRVQVYISIGQSF